MDHVVSWVLRWDQRALGSKCHSPKFVHLHSRHLPVEVLDFRIRCPGQGTVTEHENGNDARTMAEFYLTTLDHRSPNCTSQPLRREIRKCVLCAGHWPLRAEVAYVRRSSLNW